jgi:hypothetical protein
LQPTAGEKIGPYEMIPPIGKGGIEEERFTAPEIRVSWSSLQMQKR